MLEIRGVALSYGGVRALDGVSLDVPARQITTVVGSNGAGKSSLMKAIAGLERPSLGSITLEGESLLGLAPSAIVARGLALVPEGRELFPRMSVQENLLVGATLIRSAAARRSSLERVLSLFPVLERKLGTMAGSMSGGEQQMLAFGRALMAEPRVLLLDEPSIGLAPLIEEQLMASIREVTQRLGMAVLLVEQNAMLALEASQQAYVMELGRIVREGPSSELINDPSVIASYLGG
jgi:branched-chain amino acid transport system ATP-binding protein